MVDEHRKKMREEANRYALIQDAAPEMYEALKAMVDQVKNTTWIVGTHETHAAYNSALEAISKAEGKP
jgi:hypothetical protein